MLTLNIEGEIMKKRILAIVLCVMMVLSVVPLGRFKNEKTFEMGDKSTIQNEDSITNINKDYSLWEFEPYGEGVALTKYLGTQTDIYVPNKLIAGETEYTVLKLADSLFENNDAVNSITLASGILEIGDKAFYDCDSLVCILLSNELTLIGNEAFYSCDSFNSVILYESLSDIGDNAFAECSNLVTYCYSDTYSYTYVSQNGIEFKLLDSTETPKVVTYDYLLYHISNGEATLMGPSGSFRGESSLFVVPAYVEGVPVTKVSNSAFADKTFYPIGSKISSTWTMELPNTVKHIGEYAFKGTSLQLVNIPDGITSIEEGVFQYSYLYRIEFGENIKTIGDFAFESSNISELPNLENVEYIGYRAFAYTNLYELPEMPNVKYLGDYAFSGTLLGTVVYPSYIPQIGEGLFYGCSSLQVAYIEFFEDILPMSTFDDCASLERVYISEYQWLWEEAFSGCPNLVLHIYDDTDGYYDQNTENPKPYFFVSSWDEAAPIVYLDGISYYVNTNIGEVTLLNCYEPNWYMEIPETVEGYPVTAINTRAFYGTYIYELVLPNTIKTFGREAFSQCTNLSIINIPEAVVSLPRETFYSCTNLSSIEFPTTLETVGPYAFAYSGLEVLPDFTNVREIEYFAFAYCPNITEIVFPINTVVGQGAFCDCDSVKSVIIPEGVETLGYSVLAGNDAMETVIIPKSVTTIREYAIYGSNLVLGIYSGSCAEQYALENNIPYFNVETEPDIETVIENGIKYFIIDNEAHIVGPVGSVYSVTIPDTINGYPVTIIRDYAFAETSIRSIKIPDTIREIGDSAFYWTNLTSINLSEGLERIGDYAFFWTNLYSVYIPDSLVYLGDGAFTYSSLSKLPDLKNIKHVGYFTFGHTSIGGTIVLESDIDYGGSVFTGCDINKVIVEKGTKTIPGNMFEDCRYLSTVIIPSSVTEIASNAFKGCGKVILHVFEGSYAHQYAIENNLEYFILRYEENPEIAYGTSIEGTVYNKDGSVASGVNVEIYYDNGTLKEIVTTDENGKYTFVYAEVGGYTIKAYNTSGGSASTRISVKRMNVFNVFVSGDTLITLKTGYDVSGVINSSDASVKLTDTKGNVINTVNVIDKNFVFTNVVNGTYLIVAETEFGSVNKEITVYNGDVINVNLTINTNVATIKGYVEVANRKGNTERRDWVTISVYNESGVVVATCKSYDGGYYEIDNLPFGDYSIVATVSEMRPDKEYGYERNHELYGYGYVSLTENGVCELDTIVLYEKNIYRATVSGKANIKKDKSKSCEFIMYNAFGVEFARINSENGKYSFVNVEDGLYIVMAITENDGMGYAVLVVHNGKVKGNTNINITKSEKIRKQEENFINDVPELNTIEQAEEYRIRISEEKRFYDELSEKEKKQLSKKYIQLLNKYIELLTNCSYNANGVEMGGLVVSADELLNCDEISFAITVDKQEMWVDNTTGVETEKDFINHNMKDKAGNSQIVEYYEITMTKTANGDEKVITSVYKDTDAMGKFRITLDIPEEYRGMKNYSLVHVHCGEVTVLADLDDNPDTITVEIDKFSTFALATTNEELFDEAESTVSLDDIITFKGYSVGPDGASMCAGFAVDYVALELYEEKTGETVDFGVVFTSYEYLNGENPLVSQSGEAIMLENGAVLKTSLTGYSYSTYEFILTDISSELADHSFAISAYLFNGSETLYVQGNGLSSGVGGVSLNELINQ